MQNSYESRAPLFQNNGQWLFCVVARLASIPFHQAVVAFLVLPLVLGSPRILGDAVLRYLHQNRQFLPQGDFLLLQLRGVAERLTDEPGIGGNLLRRAGCASAGAGA